MQPGDRPNELWGYLVMITATSFTDAKRIGTVFRDGSPVLLNLGELPDDEAKRLVDFAAGLIFQGHGIIERVTGKVFVLTPGTILTSAELATST
jgi:cell division inhibitor SepF